ncbi:MAG: hypothetical protein AAB553_00945 [Patescibacteria group bacterium]
MFNQLIKNYTRRTGKAWQDAMKAKEEKISNVGSVVDIASSQKIEDVPIHPPHVVFDKTYVVKQQAPDLAELAKTQEAMRHLQFHDHGHQIGVAY